MKDVHSGQLRICGSLTLILHSQFFVTAVIFQIKIAERY